MRERETNTKRTAGLVNRSIEAGLAGRDNQDVPDPNGIFETSSVGGLWPPETASHHRCKAFYPRVIGDDDELRKFMDHFDSARRESGASRVQFRAIVNGDLLRKMEPEMRQYVEAVMSIDPGEFGTDPAIVYFSWNDRTRTSDPRDRAIIEANYASAQTTGGKSIKEIFDRVEQAGYQIEILNTQDLSDKDFDSIYKLYKAFGWKRKAVKELIANPNNTISVARYEGEIVSAGIAEKAAVPVDGNILRLVEITEAATLPPHARNGLYTAVSTQLMQCVADESRQNAIFGGEVDVVFGEGNGLAPGVLYVAAGQKRRFARETGKYYGFENSGVLTQQVPISGPERRTAYNDLVVTYLRRSDLHDQY